MILKFKKMIAIIVILSAALIYVIWAWRESERVYNILLKAKDKSLEHETQYWRKVVNRWEDNAVNYQFILGSIETGTVWALGYEENKNIEIGDIIRLVDIEGEGYTAYSIDRFNGVKNSFISFYVTDTNHPV